MLRKIVRQIAGKIRGRYPYRGPSECEARPQPAPQSGQPARDSGIRPAVNARHGQDARSRRQRSRGPITLELPIYTPFQGQNFDPSANVVSAIALLAVHQQITGLRPWHFLRESGDISKMAVLVIVEIFKYAAITHGATELLFWTDSRVVQTSNSVHLSASDGIVKVRRGVPVREWLQDKRQTHLQDSRFFVHNFILRDHSQSGPNVGGMAVSFATPSPDARLPLTLISQSLHQLVTQSRYLYISANVDKLAEYFGQYLKRDHKPGTTFANAVKKIPGYLSADATSYVTVSGSKAVVEYRAWAPNRNVLLDTHPWQELPTELLPRLQSGQPFYFDSKHLAMILSGDSRPRKILVLPVVRDGDAIGFFASEFFGRRPRIELELLPKIHKSIEPLSADARWLYQRRADSLIVDPLFRGRDTHIVEGRCGILMPFVEDWSDRVWNRALRPTLEVAGFDPVRADDLYGHDVMEDIWSMILSSEVVVADTTNRNANVFYELGIAHTLGKRVILLTQSVQDIPFDLNRYRHIVYQDNVEGFDALQDSLSRYLAEVVASRAS